MPGSHSRNNLCLGLKSGVKRTLAGVSPYEHILDRCSLVADGVPQI